MLTDVPCVQLSHSDLPRKQPKSGYQEVDELFVVYILQTVLWRRVLPTRLQLARRDIIEFFENDTRHVFKQREVERILSANRQEWQLAKSMAFREFLEYLLKGRRLRRLEFPFPHRREIRYTWGSVSLEEVLLTIKPRCHFSHYTAVQLHELTEQDPQTLYINSEQTPKPVPESGLAQQRIDQAFSRKPRMTRNVAIVKGANRKGIKVCLLNSKHTSYVGVEERDIRLPGEKEAIQLRLTDVERTLIDIAVRPFYAGGIAEVQKAYRRAVGRASVNRIAGLLRNLGYVYPYHQAIGAHLETAGFDKNAVDLFHERFEYEFDFYLSYGMKETEYVSRWRIHVPKGFSQSSS